MAEQLIDITETAQDYLRDLLSKQDQAEIGVRIFVERPGTPHAEWLYGLLPGGRTGRKRCSL